MKKNNILIITATLSFILFILILLGIYLNWPILKLDIKTNSLMQSIETPSMIKLSNYIGEIFSTKILIAVAFLLSIYFLIKKNKEDSVFSAATISIGAIFVFIIKNLVHRLRPENISIIEDDFSFPSGHAAMSLIFFEIITYLIFKNTKSNKIKIITLVISILAVLIISFSRLILDAHWLTDIIAGLSLGLFILIFCILFRKVMD